MSDMDPRLVRALHRENSNVITLPTRTEVHLRQPQAAAHLGVSISSLRRYHKAGLPVHRVMGVALYKASELDRWVLQQSKG